MLPGLLSWSFAAALRLALDGNRGDRSVGGIVAEQGGYGAAIVQSGDEDAAGLHRIRDAGADREPAMPIGERHGLAVFEVKLGRVCEADLDVLFAVQLICIRLVQAGCFEAGVQRPAGEQRERTVA